MYVNKNNKYLLVQDDTVSWHVTNSVETDVAGIKSGSAPDLCPASARSTYNKWQNIKSWQYVDSSDQWRDGDITVTCDLDNILC